MIEKENLKYKELKVINSALEVAKLINHEGVDLVTYINLDKKCIESLKNEDEETRNETMLKIPTLEELCPYNITMHEYIEKMKISIPLKETASSYFRRNKMMSEFYIFRQERAVEDLKQWLQEQNVQIIIKDNEDNNI